MHIARKYITVAISLGLWLTLEPLCNAEAIRAGRIVLDVPDGGMSLVAPPSSVSEFKHRQYDVTLTAEVVGANNYEYWKFACSPGKNDSDPPAAYQVGMLARGRWDSAGCIVQSSLVEHRHVGKVSIDQPGPY
jgi:hypothetical protein